MKRMAVLLTVALVVVSMMVGFGAAIAFAAADDNASCLGRTVSVANQLGSGAGGQAQAVRAQEPGAPGVGDIAPCR